MPERDWRFWLDKALSKSSLTVLSAAAVSFVGWAWTGSPLWAWLSISGGGMWGALMYYLGTTASGETQEEAERRRQREGAVKEVEEALRPLIPTRRRRDEEAHWARFESRVQQLRRIVRLEQLILTNLASTPSGIDVLSPRHVAEVTEFVDQAVDLSQRRVLLLRALQANPVTALRAELQELEARRARATDRVAAELDELIRLKRDQLESVARWQEELQLAEINLDQIEAFLQSLAYDRTVTESNVSHRIARLQTRIRARQESLQELQRRVAGDE